MVFEDSPRHIIACGGLVRNKKGDILLVNTPRGDWEFPGGQVEEGEMLPDALRREILEETGIKTEITNLVSINSNLNNPPIINFDFVCIFIGGEIKPSDESINVEWIAADLALSKILRPVIRDRLKLMLNYAGQTTYRAYTVDSHKIETTYEIHHQRFV